MNLYKYIYIYIYIYIYTHNSYWIISNISEESESYI